MLTEEIENPRPEERTLNAILNGLETFYDSPWIHNLRLTMQNFPEAKIADALSRNQILSKKWAVEKIYQAFGENLGMVFILGGWYGTLAAMLFESKLFRELQIRSFDIDPACAPIADSMNRDNVVRDWKFKASTADMLWMLYDLTVYEVQRANGTKVVLESVPDLIINTCCEHLSEFDTWFALIPKGKRLVLQSNNFVAPKDHVNCVNSLEEFQRQAPLSEILFAGTLDLKDYKRFMLVGIK